MYENLKQGELRMSEFRVNVQNTLVIFQVSFQCVEVRVTRSLSVMFPIIHFSPVVWESPWQLVALLFILLSFLIYS